MPVRFVCAPVGSGKTTLLRAYAERSPRVRYAEVPPAASLDDLHALLASDGTVREVVLDALDAAQHSAVETLMRQVAAEPAAFPRVIATGRAWSALQVQSLAARGLAAVFDGRDLAFDRDETEALAQHFEVAYDAQDLEELLQVTEGWPVALTWIIRDASDAGATLRGAFERWAERHGFLLLEYVAANVAREPAIRRAFEAMLADEGTITQGTLGALEAAGCPVARLRTRLRPYRVLRALTRPSGGERKPGTRSPQLLALNLLGTFSCAIGEHPVAFTRRRDQNLLVYLALARGARATREELLEAFWPDASHAVASQGLRTTLSRLRRAIGDAAGSDAAQYLRVDANVSLVLDRVVVDARRFAEHVELGKHADARGEIDAACRHYRIASGLYKDHLLASEAVEPSLQGPVREYRALFETTVTRLMELSGGGGSGGQWISATHLALVGGTA